MAIKTGAGQTPGGSGEPRHAPVLLDEAIAALRPRAGGRYLDATFGAGGYTRAILAVPGALALALDRDPTAVRGGADLVSSAKGRLTLVEARFSQLESTARAQGFAPLDGIVFDIGVSSMQFDEAERGFSFRGDGPLDMRMEGRGRSAADIVNEADEETLADILYYYGEERASRRIARAIAHDREFSPFVSTKALADLIARVAPGRPGEIHPATKSFQALRIAVNDELGELLGGLAAAERVLAEGGRLVVVTFHSLEDRIVKQFLAERCGRGETGSRRLPGEVAPAPKSFLCDGRQPIAPTPREVAANPRARSAKLRHATRTGAPPLPLDGRLMRLARLPVRDTRDSLMLRLLNIRRGRRAGRFGGLRLFDKISDELSRRADREDQTGDQGGARRHRGPASGMGLYDAPRTLQPLADKYLPDLKPLHVTQLVNAQALPQKAHGDSIGAKLSEIGLSSADATPPCSIGGDDADFRTGEGEERDAKERGDGQSDDRQFEPRAQAMTERLTMPQTPLETPPPPPDAQAVEMGEPRPCRLFDEPRDQCAAHASRRARLSDALRSDLRQALLSRLQARAGDHATRRGGSRLRLASRHSRPQRGSARERREGHVGFCRAAALDRQGRGHGASHRGPAGRRLQGSARAARLQEGFRLGQARGLAASAR